MAGIVDGEGSICLTRVNRGKSLTPTISVDSTDRELLEWVKEAFRGHITRKNCAGPNRKEAWSWRLKGHQALDLLEALRPYMKIVRKQRRTDFLVTEYRQTIPRNGHYTPALWEKRETMVARFKEL